MIKLPIGFKLSLQSRSPWNDLTRLWKSDSWCSHLFGISSTISLRVFGFFGILCQYGCGSKPCSLVEHPKKLTTASFWDLQHEISLFPPAKTLWKTIPRRIFQKWARFRLIQWFKDVQGLSCLCCFGSLCCKHELWPGLELSWHMIETPTNLEVKNTVYECTQHACRM